MGLLKGKMVLCITMTAAILGACSAKSTQTPVETAPVETVSEAVQTTQAPTEKEETTTVAEETVKETESSIQETESDETNSAYLKEYFDVTVGDTTDAAAFSDYLKKIAGEEAPAVEGDLTGLSMVKAAVEAADYAELAMSYTSEKTAKRLSEHGVSADVDETYAPYLACAMDVKLISDKSGADYAGDTAPGQKDIEDILMAIAEANGDARNYLGMSDDQEIYAKVDQAWNSFILFDDGELSEVGRQSVVNGVTTGYGLKSDAYSARFLPELTLQYGHSDIKHAHQLIGLLNSENIVAKIQLEPKISIYEYLLEWGPVPEATPTYEVKQFDDLYLVYAVEYDMQLEFMNTDDLMRFDSVIKEYAKKNEGNEDAVGLIYASWWQPLYSTVRTDMPSEDYHEICDCVVKNGIYSIHPFCLPEDKDNVTAKLKEFSNGLEVENITRYCNTAFYNYMTGEDYQ